VLLFTAAACTSQQKLLLAHRLHAHSLGRYKKSTLGYIYKNATPALVTSRPAGQLDSIRLKRRRGESTIGAAGLVDAAFRLNGLLLLLLCSVKEGEGKIAGVCWVQIQRLCWIQLIRQPFKVQARDTVGSADWGCVDQSLTKLMRQSFFVCTHASPLIHWQVTDHCTYTAKSLLWVQNRTQSTAQ